jgi:hypothetical protein
MTPKQLFHRVCNSVDGVEVDASPHDTASALLSAGTALCGVGLRQLEGAERESLLQDLESSVDVSPAGPKRGRGVGTTLSSTAAVGSVFREVAR